MIIWEDFEEDEINSEYNRIKADVRKDFLSWPFLQLARAIIDPMVRKIETAARHGMMFPKEYTAPIDWYEAYDLERVWADSMEREAEIRPILADCKAILL